MFATVQRRARVRIDSTPTMCETRYPTVIGTAVTSPTDERSVDERSAENGQDDVVHGELLDRDRSADPTGGARARRGW